VEVHVVHRLAGLRAGVGDEAVARLGAAVADQALLERHRLRPGDDLAEQSRVGGDQRGRGGVVLLGDHQHVRRRLRVDVAEGEDAVGLVDDVGRDLTGDHAAEEAVGHVRSLGRDAECRLVVVSKRADSSGRRNTSLLIFRE
jgi:hypothetical protein